MLAAGLSVTASVPFLHVLLLRRMNLIQEVVEALFCLTILNIIQLGSLRLRHTNFHLCQGLLFSNAPSQHFLLSVHVIVAIEVDGLRPSRCVAQILLHFLAFQVVPLLLCKLICGIKFLIGPDYPLAKLILLLLLRGCTSAHHTFMLLL